MRVVIWTKLAGRRFRQRLEADPRLDVVVPDAVEAAISAGRGADLLITDGAYDAELARALVSDKGRLRFIQLVTAGYDGLEAHGVPDGVVVSNAGPFFAATVAEHAVALLLALLRQVPQMVEDTRARIQDRRVAARMRSLQGASVALVGFGHIGREVAHRLRPFGPRILALVRAPRTDPLADEMHPMAALHDVLARADIAIVAVPLTPETQRLLSRSVFDGCKPGMILVNMARGEVVDSAALAAALQDGRVAAAGLDVTDPEPLPRDHVLWGAPNLIVTPHVAGAGVSGAAERMADLVLANIDLLAAGKPPLHRVSL